MKHVITFRTVWSLENPLSSIRSFEPKLLEFYSGKMNGLIKKESINYELHDESKQIFTLNMNNE